MKKTRRICTLIMVLVMVLAMAVPAMAETTTPTGNVTFTGGAEGATYSAYRLLNATHGNEDNYAYTLNAKYTTILQTVTGKTEQNDIVDYISTLDADDIRAFADSVYAKIQEAKLEADATTNTNKFTSIAQGYYLIAETALGTDFNGATDTWSLTMIDTVGDADVTVVTKESPPTIDKEVYNYNDSTAESHWGEHADYDIGDSIPFRIYARVSGQYDHYINYWYKIGDTMDEGLTYNNDLKITIGSVDVTSQFKVEVKDDGFTATANLKNLTGVTITHNSVIEVEYTCTLNENAVSGATGNKNEVVLKYQNDPYDEDDPEYPGETPKDTNIVFTYDSIVNKIDSTGAKLEGAGFTLYKWNYTENEWQTVGEEITGVTEFSFNGLDKGIYKLVETTVPDGYNKADDIEFHIHPVYDTTKDPVELTSLKVVDADGDELTNFTINKPAGSVTANIVNNAGAELPSTGGVGTTLFYVIGGLMVAAAVVLLVTKKRMSTEA